MKNKILIIATAYFLLHCSKKAENKVFTGHDYFPLAINQYRIYEVDSIFYDDFYIPTKIDTFSYLVKEYIESTDTDAEGNTVYRIVRSILPKDSTSWQLTDVWSSYRTPSMGVKNEENIPRIKLIFPPRERKQWDINAFNDKTEQMARYEKVNTPTTINSYAFDSTLTIILQNDSTLIDKKTELEKYAIHIGLIYREHIEVKTNINGSILSGFKTYMRIKKWN